MRIYFGFLQVLAGFIKVKGCMTKQNLGMSSVYLSLLDQRLLGEEHPNFAGDLNNLAALYYAQGQSSKAEPLLVQAVKIRQRHLGSNHPDTVNSLNGLVMVRDRLNSTAKDLPNFNQKAKKSNSNKKPQGFGKG